MINNPYFSIVIPTYNRQEFILATLATVFIQTFKDFEVIVVDNCSTDNTYQYLKPFIDQQKLVFIQHEQNLERASSRNTGMKHARGEYLTFLDSDDFMYPNNLADAYQFITENPEIKVFHSLYELVDSSGKILYRYSFSNLNNSLKEIAYGNFMSCIGNFIHRDVYTSVKWDDNAVLTGSEDYDFWLRLIGKYPHVGRINRVNNAILHHSARTVCIYDLNKMDQRLEYFFNKIDQDLEYSVFGSYKGFIKSYMLVIAANYAKENKDFKKMWNYLKMSMRYNWRVIHKKYFIFSGLNYFKGRFQL